ncbi:MAG: thioesterase family protein [Aeromicrobium sp.]|uniref:thioesterase family protein n=1 Tax=Aeromicrobium sp. TaxID=1871063 RepID=UPI0026138CE1|nr:thioesterase family protein [Aeromicrobium sp.]MDF1704925.1 thioesterase family protein [Aeromicrobium sp.]
MSETTYFLRHDARTFVPTEHVSGAWNAEEQHIAPALGLLAHAVERDAVKRGRELRLGRISCDIFGVVPMEAVTVVVEVVRPGRTIELVEARLEHAGRRIVVARAWLVQQLETGGIAGTPVTPLPEPAGMPAWDPTTVWPGGFIASAELRRREIEPGRAQFWVRPRVDLLRDERVSATARMIGVLDIANGMTVRQDPREVLFPNLDLTVHLVRDPVGEWIGFDTSVTFSGDGRGLTSSIVHDVDGVVGQSTQVLTVRPHRTG